MRPIPIVSMLCICACAAVRAADDDTRLRKLEAENRLMKTQMQRLMKELSALKAALKAVSERQDRIEADAAAAKAQAEAAKAAAAHMLRPEKMQGLNNVMTTLGQYLQMTPEQRKKALPQLQKQADEAKKLWSEPPKQP